MRKLALRLVLLMSLVLPGSATAQAWLDDRQDREGPGIKVGKSLVFHPGALLEGGYDTNPIRESNNPPGAGRLRISSYADLATRSKSRDDREVAAAPKTNFRLGLAGYYDFFFSDVDAVDKQDDFGIDTDLNFILFPSGPYTFFLKALYGRTVQPYESPAEFHARHTFRPGLGFQGEPGGGILMLSAFYDANLMIYEDDFISPDRNKVTHNVRLETAWKFFPKTSFVSRVVLSPTIYYDANFNNNSFPIRSLFGLQGLITPRFGLSLFVGYGASFYEDGDDFEHVIANGELMFFIGPLVTVRVGGQRDFVDSFYANYYVKSGGYLKYEHMFGRVVYLSVKGDAYHRDYSEFSGVYLNAAQGADRSDIWVGATLLLEFRITDWLAAIASAVYQSNISDFTYNTTEGEPDPVQFHRFEGLGGVRAYY
jgi:hypothetical protein